MIQYAADGLVTGATLALGAIGLTLTYDILRFANFAHGEFLAFGAYFTLLFAAFLAGGQTIGPLTFGWGFLVAVVLAMVLCAALALVLDRLLFRPLRRSDLTITLVIASFGASLMLRNAIVFLWGSRPEYYSRNIAVSTGIVPGVRMSADELFVIGLTAVLMLALRLFLRHTPLGRSMRAVSDDPSLARVAGIDVQAVIRWTWFIGAGLAAVAGTLFGLTVQLSPEMGFNLILPMFAAAILGGIGSIHGAVVGGLIVGLAQEISVPLIGSAYKPGVAFVLMFAILLVRPTGIFGVRGR